MKADTRTPRFNSNDMRTFRKLGTKVLAVSHEEIQRREAAYKAEGKHKRGKA